MSEIQQLQDENNMDFGAEETNSLLDHPNLVAAMKKILELQLKVMVIPIVESIVGQMMENMVRKVVQEEFQRAQERLFTGEKWKSTDEGNTTQVRQLELQFLDKVYVPVYTGKEIRGAGGNYLTVALVDPLTGSCVTSGPEASAKVEIIVLTKDVDDVDGNFQAEESEDMGRPVLSQNRVTLKEGIAVLDNVKFKHKAKWTKSCKVSLVARITNLNGIAVKEAETESFLVMDRRALRDKKKHHPPSLSDHVWRLEKIGRGGRLHKLLRDANINTVKEFLISLNINAQSLKAMLKVSDETFKLIVDHAQTSKANGADISTSTRTENSAGSNFSQKMVVSAFEHMGDVESIGNEASITHFVSRSSNANGAGTSSSPRTESTAGIPSSIWKMIDERDHALPSTVPRHSSPAYSVGPGLLDGFDFLQTDYVDILSQGIDHPIHSRTGSEDFGQHLQFLIEQLSDKRTTASDSQMTGTRVASSSMARKRWRMAIWIVALGDIRARKRQKLQK